MIKLILKYLIYDNVINMIYQQVIKNFPLNTAQYEKVFIKSIDETHSGETILVVMYNVHIADSPNTPDHSIIRCEYFKYCRSDKESDWENEEYLSKACKLGISDVWHDVDNEHIITMI